MFRSPALPTLLMLALTACGAARAPVPLVGASADIGALTGEWAGDYSSAESGRSGSITFALRSAGDTAFGDVVMVPKGFGRALVPWNQPGPAGGMSQTPNVLTIRFVHVEAGHVSGTLDPYADPQTGERLLTTFNGEVKGNRTPATIPTKLRPALSQTGPW